MNDQLPKPGDDIWIAYTDEQIGEAEMIFANPHDFDCKCHICDGGCHVRTVISASTDLHSVEGQLLVCVQVDHPEGGETDMYWGFWNGTFLTSEGFDPMRGEEDEPFSPEYMNLEMSKFLTPDVTH